jgi:hypothetical protein
VGKGVRIAEGEGVELAQEDPQPLGEELGEDDAGERGGLVEGEGVERGGFAPGVAPRIVLARVLWALGSADQARQRGQEAMILA